MKQFLIVLKFELNNYFKNKSFMATTLILAVLVAAIVIVPTMIPGLLSDKEETQDSSFSTGTEVDEDDMDYLGIYVTEGAKDVDTELIFDLYPAKWTTYDSKEALEKGVESEDIQAGFVLESLKEVTYVVNNKEMYDYIGESFVYSLSQVQKMQYLMEQGLTPEQIAESESFQVDMEEEILGKDSASNYWYTYVLVFVVYILIIFYGQMIATSVTTEKSNRAIEILVTSVNSNSLIFGKVLAGAIAGILQAGIILGAGFVSYGLVREKWGGILDMLFDIPGYVLIVFAIFAVLSYLLYAFVFGMLGALVSKTEDISKSASPVMMIYIASFIIAMVGMSSNPDSALMKVSSFIPFTSGNAMFIRVSMGSVAVWEVIVSALILVASCVVAGILAAKIFRFGTLHYGNPIKFKTALKKARE